VGVAVVTPEPDYVVLRAHPDLGPRFLPAHLDGRWYDVSKVPVGKRGELQMWAVALAGSDVVAVPAGRFEVRPTDGAVAEVWEFRP
jgi:hypothetical protein